MSGKVVGLVFSKLVGGAAKKAVLAYCAERADDQGRGIWVAKTTMAAGIEMDRATVYRAVAALTAAGLLRQVGTRPHANGITVEYDIDLDVLHALPNATTAAGVPVARRASKPVAQGDPSHHATGGVAPCDGKGSHHATQTVPEPSVGGGGGAAPSSSEREAEVVPLRPRPGPADASSFRDRLLAAMGAEPGSGLGGPTDMVVAQGWLDAGASEDECLAIAADTTPARRGRRLSSFKYFNGPIQRHLDAKAQGPLPLGLVVVGQPSPTLRQRKGRTDVQSQAFLAASREPGVADGPPRDDLRALLPARR